MFKLPTSSRVLLLLAALTLGSIAPASSEVLLYGFERSEGYTGANGSNLAGQGGWTLGAGTFTLNTLRGYQSDQSMSGGAGNNRTDSPLLFAQDLTGLSLRFTNPDAYFQTAISGVNVMRFRVQMARSADDSNPWRMEFNIAYTGSASSMTLSYNVDDPLLVDRRGTAYAYFNPNLIDLDQWSLFRFEADVDAVGGPVYSVSLNGTLILDRIPFYGASSADANMRLLRLQFWGHNLTGNAPAGVVSYDQVMGYAYVPAIPETSTVAMLLFGSVVLLVKARRSVKS